MKAWCDRQERHHKEVIKKLSSWGYYGDPAQEMLADLISQNYVNEERFARAYCSGKFRIKKWGRQKIKANLKGLGISDYCMKKGLSEIDPEEYAATIQQLIKRKTRDYKGLNDFQRKGKVAGFLQRKGYESDMVWDAIRSNT
jgi:regulatory protein